MPTPPGTSSTSGTRRCRSSPIPQRATPPHFTTVRERMGPARLPPTVPPPALSLRSQLALALLTGAKKRLTLEDVVRLKYSYRMLLAERGKPDPQHPGAEIGRAHV